MAFEIETLSNFKMVETVDARIVDFKGDIRQLESAIGALVFGRHVGWKVLLLIHDTRTLRKYEKILGVEFRKVLPEVGVRADKSVAWRYAQKIGEFWKIVKGEIRQGKSAEAVRTSSP